VTGIAEDITDQRVLEDQLRQAQKMEAVGTLAGGIAHDFNNLLTIIGGYAQMLLDAARAEDPRREKLEQILSASNRASTLTSQLLAFSRRQVLQPKVIQVNNLLSNMEALLRRVIGEHITVRTVLSTDLHCVRADPNQLEQVFINLAANARDAMPNGGQFKIETTMADALERGSERDLKSEKWVRLKVSDTGCGMDSISALRTRPEISGCTPSFRFVRDRHNSAHRHAQRGQLLQVFSLITGQSSSQVGISIIWREARYAAP
jgi:signal transduction histidine kinase